MLSEQGNPNADVNVLEIKRNEHPAVICADFSAFGMYEIKSLVGISSALSTEL